MLFRSRLPRLRALQRLEGGGHLADAGRRPAQPEDIVPTALFLAAPDSDYITGQVIPIEGGMILV